MVMLHELFHCYEAYNKNRGKLADIMIYSPIDNSRDLKWYENRKQLYVLLQKLNINIHWLFRIAAPASPWLTTVNPSPDIIFRFPSAKMLACAFNRCHNSQVLFLELKTCTLDLSLQRQVWSALLFWDSVKSRRRLNILSLSASSFSFIMRRRRWSQRKTKANRNIMITPPITDPATTPSLAPFVKPCVAATAVELVDEEDLVVVFPAFVIDAEAVAETVPFVEDKVRTEVTTTVVEAFVK